MNDKEIRSIFKELKCQELSENISFEAFKSVEDGAEYEVWLICDSDKKYVLKKAKAYELDLYLTFFKDEVEGVPRFEGACKIDGVDYFLMEYVSGKDICCCDRSSLIKVLDALISIQEAFWADSEHKDCGFSFERSLVGRTDRGKYLGEEIFERVYNDFLEEYKRLPRTLCHDDLLPFNVIVSDDKAYLIDWEYGGILPYPASLARLLAHGEEKDGAMFYIKDSDRQFAIDYYYEKLIKSKNISYSEYRKTMDLFLFYEYCEWIMLGNKYEDASPDLTEKYVNLAKAHLKLLSNYN